MQLHHHLLPIFHRDAPGSPIRHPAADANDLPPHLQPFKTAVGLGRALRARLKHAAVHGNVSYYKMTQGDFYLTAQVGTPPQQITFLLDTGSELVWTQCDPCSHCSRPGTPLFQPSRSSSLRHVACYFPICSAVYHGFTGQCSKSTISCPFSSSFADGSTLSGALAIDSFSMQGSSTVAVKHFVFGCASHDQETVPTNGSGIMGLGPGALSFPSQFLRNIKYAMKFSYCLPDRFTSLNASGAILFGDSGLSAHLKYTSLLQTVFAPMFYYVELRGISIGNKLLPIPQSSFQVDAYTGNGGTVLDSGAAFTSLVESALRPLQDTLVQHTKHLNPFKNNDDDSICYNLTTHNLEHLQFPHITFHFSKGAKLELEAGSILWYTGDVFGDVAVACTAFMLDPEQNTIGNYQQQNYWIEYDLEKSRVGFAKANCVMD